MNANPSSLLPACVNLDNCSTLGLSGGCETMQRNNVFERHQLHHCGWELLICCGHSLVSSWSEVGKGNPFCGEGWAPNTESIAQALRIHSDHSSTWQQEFLLSVPHSPFFLSKYLHTSLSEHELQRCWSRRACYPFVG